MKILAIGFDSAWSANNTGAIVGVLKENDCYTALSNPQAASFNEASQNGVSKIIKAWQKEHSPDSVLILIDQPTIVTKSSGQRAVENIVSSPVGRRYGGVQSSNTGKADLFGDAASIWTFLEAFGGAFDPIKLPLKGSGVIETYPVLAMIAMGWGREDNHPRPRPTGRLSKYNPSKKGPTFSDDWKYVCNNSAEFFNSFGLKSIAEWLTQARDNPTPKKLDQDCLDACLCLLVGIHLIEKRACLFIGEMDSGYMVVPFDQSLNNELVARCNETRRNPKVWVQQFKLT